MREIIIITVSIVFVIIVNPIVYPDRSVILYLCGLSEKNAGQKYRYQVLCPFIGTGVCNYRQEVTGGRILSILGDDVFHARLPLYGELLPGLSSTVRDDSVLQVRFFQIGHINE